MWHKSKPLFFDSLEKGNRAVSKINRPIFFMAKGITKKPGDINDVSNSKVTYNQKSPKIERSEIEINSFIKNAKTINSKTGHIDDNKWMWVIMKRAGQI